jgi:hypothetical protein
MMNNEYQEVGKLDLRKFTEGLGEVIKNFAEVADVLNSLRDFSPLCASMLELSLPFQSYAAANYPLGKSIRGFKKWSKRNV